MTTATFDTLGYFEKLISAGVPEQQAKVQADTMREVIEDRLMHLDGNVATKADIQAVKADMRSLEAKLEAKIDMSETKLLLSLSNQKHDIVKWMIGLLLGQTALLLTILRVMGILK